MPCIAMQKFMTSTGEMLSCGSDEPAGASDWGAIVTRFVLVFDV